MSKTIRIECKGADAIDYKKLRATQGDLKELTDENYEKLKDRILKLGFSEPISVWKNRSKMHVLNGHQRLATITRMVEDEGYKVKPIPVSYIKAKDLNEAKRKILSLTSQFGQIDGGGLTEFLEDTDIDLSELENYNLAGFDVTKYIGEHETTEIEENEEIEIEKNPTAQVKTVQLYFSANTADEFQAMLNKISERHETNSITESILLAVNMAYDKHIGVEQ